MIAVSCPLYITQGRTESADTTVTINSVYKTADNALLIKNRLVLEFILVKISEVRAEEL